MFHLYHDHPVYQLVLVVQDFLTVHQCLMFLALQQRPQLLYLPLVLVLLEHRGYLEDHDYL